MADSTCSAQARTCKVEGESEGEKGGGGRRSRGQRQSEREGEIEREDEREREGGRVREGERGETERGAAERVSAGAMMMMKMTTSLAFGEGSFRTMVSSDRADGRLTGESGMKDDQYPYRVLFSTPLTSASRQFRAAWRTRPWLILQGGGRGGGHIESKMK